MKSLFKKIILLFICFMLCACSVKNDNTLTIDMDGRVKYDVLIALDKSLIQALYKMNIIKSEEDLDKYVSENIKDDYLNGFVKKEYKDSEYIGNEYVYEVDNIEQLTTGEDVKVQVNNNFAMEKEIFTKKYDVYTADFIFNLNDKYDVDKLNFDNTFTVNLPIKALSSNADKVLNDGKTLIWNIENGEAKKINFSFTFSNIKGYISLGLIVFDIFAIITLIVLVIKRKRKNEK